ncbi:MAG: hypothetical protein ACI9U2_002714 [Bradymonadia bacterium]
MLVATGCAQRWQQTQAMANALISNAAGWAR